MRLRTASNFPTDHPAHVLRKMPRKAENFAHERAQVPGRGEHRVEAGFAKAGGEAVFFVPAFEPLGKRVDLVE